MRLLPKQFSDLVTFTRASGGTSFRPVGYGPDKITGTGPQAATLSGVDLVENTASAHHGIRLTNSTSAARADFRFRAKAGTKSWLWVYFENYVGGSAWFDLSTGSVGTQEPGVVATMTAAGGGYFDCVLTKWNFSTALNCNIYAVTANGSTAAYLGTGSVAFQIASYSVQEVILDRPGDPIQLFTSPTNVPRIDYDPVSGACKGLLIEEQRTNLLPYSSAPSSSGVTLSIGAKQADFESVGLYEWTSTINGQAGVEVAGGTVPAGKTYVASAFFKKGTSRYFGLGIYDGSDVFAVFDSDTGVVAISGAPTAGASASCGATHLGGGIYRIWMLYTARSEAGSVTSFKFGLPSETTSLSGGSLSGVSTVLMGGWQCEEGSFPTSYIPTTGAAATRAADVASVNTLSPWYNTGEGTLFADFRVTNPGLPLPQFVVSSQNAEIINARSATVAGSWDGSSEVNSSNGAANIANSAKVAVGFSGSGKSITLNGIAPTSGATAFPTPTALYLGASFGTRCINGHIRQIRYIPKRLTNAELQALTA